MSFVKKIFGKDKKFSDYVEDSEKGNVEVSEQSKERADYYKELAAQRDSTTQILGSDEMEQAEIEKAVKKIMPRTMADFKVVKRDDDSDDDNGEAVAQDEAVNRPNTRGDELMIARRNEIYQAYALVNPRILRHFISRAFIGYPACTILGQHEVIGLCCSMPAEDAIAAGYILNCSSVEHKKDDKHIQKESDWLEELKLIMQDSNIDKTCVKFGTYKRLYGIGIAIPICELNDGHTFAEPYNPDYIKPKSFRGFNVIDPQRALWDLDADSLWNPMSEWYQKPEFLRLVNNGDVRIHRSWIITANFREVGEDLLATYNFGGQPLSQLLYERVFCADKLANEVVALAMSKRTVVMEVNKEELIMAPKNTDKFISKFNHYRTNSAIAFKGPGEQITQLETSLADLQPLSAQQYQWVASWSGIPMTKLCKNVPSGLQATGQYENEDYEQTINPIRMDAKLILNRWLEMYIASSYPERKDLKVTIEFKPFITPKAAETQQIDSQRVSMVCQLVQTGVASVTEARGILKKGTTSTFGILSSTTPELLMKIEKMRDPEAQQEMQMKSQKMMGGMGGMPGAGIESEQSPENQKMEENKKAFEEALNTFLDNDKPNDEGGNANQPEGDTSVVTHEDGQESQSPEEKPQ